MSLMGVDIGTTGCKAAAYSLEGRVLASAYREYPVERPAPGYVELDSALVWDRIKAVIAEAAAGTAGDPVTALCCSSMGEAMVPVSADRRILGKSIVASMDLRGGEYLDAVVAKVGREAFYDINPNTLAPTYSLPKLLWIRRHQPALYRDAYKFLLWSDFLAFMLGCEPVTSHALANRTLLYDIRREAWSPTLLDAAGIDAAKLPQPVMSGAVAGRVDDRMAAELGLPRGVAVVVGAHDQCCNALGAGIREAGSAVCGIGTFECITPVYAGIPDSASMMKAGLNVEHFVLPGLYVSFIYNQAGSLVRWHRDTFAMAEKRQASGGVDLYGQLMAEVPDEPTRLLALPYFEPSGAPDFISDAAGAIVGLRTDTTRGEILRALMEGSTFYFVRSLETLRSMKIATSRFVATGGGAKSDVWLQIKADIMGVPFVRPAITECGMVGAAILAGLAVGAYRSAAEGVGVFVKDDRVFEPNPRKHAWYREHYVRYEQLLAATRPVLKALSSC